MALADDPGSTDAVAHTGLGFGRSDGKRHNLDLAGRNGGPAWQTPDGVAERIGRKNDARCCRLRQWSHSINLQAVSNLLWSVDVYLVDASKAPGFAS